MPKFELNKLIRDGLRGEYEKTGQKATYIELSPEEHKRRLVSKLIEEIVEINFDDDKPKTIDEFGDVKQVFKDLMTLCGITDNQVESARQAKYDKKGGFEGGTYVTTLELADDDEWVEYYRKRPDIFPEK